MKKSGSFFFFHLPLPTFPERPAFTKVDHSSANPHASNPPASAKRRE
jgi:hypothetical protein